MNISSYTDDGFPIRCDVCGQSAIVNVSRPPGDSLCPSCGCFLWVQAISEITSEQQFIPDIRIAELNSRDKPSAIREMADAVAIEFGWNTLRTDHFWERVVAREETWFNGRRQWSRGPTRENGMGRSLRHRGGSCARRD